jgi:hypothetical protein
MRLQRFLEGLSLAALLAGCSACSMVSSYPVEGSSIVEPDGQAAGSYFLAKNNLRVSVTEAATKPTLSVDSIPVQDRGALIQTGFNLSPTSDDDIKIEYEGGLLKKITAKANDKTGDILVAIARLAGRYRGTRVEDIVGATFEFDPFDYAQATETNSILLKRYRSCVEVEIEPGLWSPGCGKYSLGNSLIAATQRIGLADHAVHAGELSGIYYRRPIAHRVHVVEAGKTLQIRYLDFANHAPVFRVDIDRTLFVNRETTIDFTSGALSAVHVVKPSEGLAVASLPLTIIEAFFSAPVQAVSKHKDVQTSQATLNNSRAAVIQSSAADQSGAVNRGFPGDERSGRFDRNRSGNLTVPELQDCRNIGIADPELCADLIRRNAR